MAHFRGERVAKERYRKFREVSCKALGGAMVKFNSTGFRHLLWKHGKRRSRRETKRRLALLPYAPEIVRSGEIISHKEKTAERPVHILGKHARRLSAAAFWTLRLRIDSRNVMVVVRQFRGGEKHFLSIYDRKNKKLPS